MTSLLKRISRHLVIAIPVMMAAGFLYGMAAPTGWLKHLIIPLTFLMVYPMMVTLNLQSIVQGGDGRSQFLTQLINFGIIPFVALGIGMVFFKGQPFMILGLVLAGLVPTSGMTISWTGFAKGNMAAAVKMTVIGLVAGSLATPFYVEAFLGTSIDIQLWAVMKQILFIVFLPMALGFATRRFLVGRYGMETFKQDLAPAFPSISTLGVLGIVFVALALKARTIAAAPELLLHIITPLALLYTVNYAVSTFVGRSLLPRGDAIALVYGSVMRNLSIALAIAINAFGERGSDAALVIALAYIIQVQSAAWYVKLTPLLFDRRREPACEAAQEEAGQET